MAAHPATCQAGGTQFGLTSRKHVTCSSAAAGLGFAKTLLLVLYAQQDWQDWVGVGDRSTCRTDGLGARL